jgi:hypothetical protein
MTISTGLPSDGGVCVFPIIGRDAGTARVVLQVGSRADFDAACRALRGA